MSTMGNEHEGMAAKRLQRLLSQAEVLTSEQMVDVMDACKADLTDRHGFSNPVSAPPVAVVNHAASRMDLRPPQVERLYDVLLLLWHRHSGNAASHVSDPAAEDECRRRDYEIFEAVAWFLAICAPGSPRCEHLVAVVGSGPSPPPPKEESFYQLWWWVSTRCLGLVNRRAAASREQSIRERMWLVDARVVALKAFAHVSGAALQ